jgi:hypothetical protein
MNGHFYNSSTQNVDERFGYRPAAGILQPVESNPSVNVFCLFRPLGSSEPFTLQFQKPIETVSSIYIRGIYIENITTPCNTLCLQFSGPVEPGHNTVTAGFPIANPNVVVIPGLNNADVNWEFTTPQLLAVYRQLKRLDDITLRITDAITGAPIAYDNCVLNMTLYTESWLL